MTSEASRIYVPNCFRDSVQVASETPCEIEFRWLDVVISSRFGAHRHLRSKTVTHSSTPKVQNRPIERFSCIRGRGHLELMFKVGTYLAQACANQELLLQLRLLMAGGTRDPMPAV
jgi:hypothetical protein